MSITKLSALRRLSSSNVGGSLDPRNVSGLVGWWDASASDSLFQNSDGTTAAAANGDPIGYWSDLSGNGRHMTQTTSNLRPSVITSGINGRRCVSVQSTANAGFSSVPAPTTSTSATVFVVGRYRNQNFWMHFIRADGNAFMDATDTNAVSPAASAGSPTFRVNGADVSTTRLALYNAAGFYNTYLYTITGVNVSGWSSGWRAFNYGSSYQYIGWIGECIVYSSSLSTANRNAIEAYLKLKWATP